jgi:polyisoprenoid-binding protein YceI
MNVARLTTSIAVAAALVAATGCANPADDKPAAEVGAVKPAATAPAESTATATASPTATATAAAPAPEGAGALPIDAAASTIGFVGSKVTGSHEGGFKSFRGAMVLDAEGKAVTNVSAEIDMDSTWSDNERLTGHLKNQDFFDVPKFPKSSFVSTAIEPGANLPAGATHTITGDLTLHGVTRPISFPARLAVAGPDGATLDSEFSIKRKDFGIEYAGKTDDLIRDEVVLKLALKAKKAG